MWWKKSRSQGKISKFHLLYENERKKKNNSSCKIVQFANQHNCSESKAELLRLSAQQCRQAVVMKQSFPFIFLFPPAAARFWCCDRVSLLLLCTTRKFHIINSFMLIRLDIVDSRWWSARNRVVNNDVNFYEQTYSNGPLDIGNLNTHSAKTNKNSIRALLHERRHRWPVGFIKCRLSWAWYRRKSTQQSSSSSSREKTAQRKKVQITNASSSTISERNA